MNETVKHSKTNKVCSSDFYVYLLVSDSGATYVGATVDLEKRLRQHNKEISGGAHATGSKVSKGETWVRACHVKNFPDWSAALQFEWRWKQISRKLSRDLVPLERRLMALKKLLELERPTSKAIAYKEWSKGMPEVVQEIESGLFLLL
jgi:predicted GIY-YIG superfamily endonuclease